MKKHIPFYLTLLIAPLVVFILLSNGNGSSSGLTGSPGDNGNTCVICHQGADTVTTYNFSLNLSTDIPTGGYELNTLYHLTLTPTSTGATEHGFQITAENSAAAKVGAFLITDAVNTQKGSSSDYVTHTFVGHENVTSWGFDWISPAFDVGAVTFYFSGIAGIEIVSGQTTVVGTEQTLNSYVVGGVLAVNNNQLLNFSMYPNPSNGQVTLQLPSDANQAQVSVFDYLGKSLIQKQISTYNNTIDVTNLSAGIYFVRIQTGSKVGTKKLVVR